MTSTVPGRTFANCTRVPPSLEVFHVLDSSFGKYFAVQIAMTKPALCSLGFRLRRVKHPVPLVANVFPRSEFLQARGFIFFPPADLHGSFRGDC